MKNDKIDLDDRYLVNESGTSDGTQDKYYRNGIWYKVDRFGGEGETEYLVSLLLENSNMPRENYVRYHRAVINGAEGCYSKDFLGKEESFITIYRLYANTYGGDIAARLARMDYDDAIEFVIRFVKEQTELDIRGYLADLCYIDRVILNEDRNFNNFGLIFNGTGFRTAPVFDNGKSLFTGNSRVRSDNTIEENKKKARSKIFSPSFELNYDYLKGECAISIHKEDALAAIRKEPESIHRDLLIYQLEQKDFL